MFSWNIDIQSRLDKRVYNQGGMGPALKANTGNSHHFLNSRLMSVQRLGTLFSFNNYWSLLAPIPSHHYARKDDPNVRCLFSRIFSIGCLGNYDPYVCNGEAGQVLGTYENKSVGSFLFIRSPLRARNANSTEASFLSVLTSVGTRYWVSCNK